MRQSPHPLRLLAIVLATFGSVSAAHGEQLLKLSRGIATSVVVEGAAPGNFTSIIGDPKIADVTFGPKNTFWFIGLTDGRTNIIVLDNKTGREIYSAMIQVGEVARPVKKIPQVHVHNKDLVTSYTIYLCDPNCTYDGEVTAGAAAVAPPPPVQPGPPAAPMALGTVNGGGIPRLALPPVKTQ